MGSIKWLYQGLPIFFALIWMAFGIGCYIVENHTVGFHLVFWTIFLVLQVSTGALIGILLRRLYFSASTDGLTQLWNRKYFYKQAALSLGVSNPEQPTGLIMIDLDNFKQVNDQLGHQSGDEVLRILANVLKQNTRPTDTVARLGGDEFAILLPDSAPDKTLAIADRVRRAVQERLVDYHVTVSVGVVSTDKNSKIDEVVSEADKALYKAKGTKNNIVVSGLSGISQELQHQ